MILGFLISTLNQENEFLYGTEALSQKIRNFHLLHMSVLKELHSAIHPSRAIYHPATAIVQWHCVSSKDLLCGLVVEVLMVLVLGAYVIN